MTAQEVRDELLLSDVAEFYAEEVTELSKIPRLQTGNRGDPGTQEGSSDLSSWEIQVFEFEETIREKISI